MDWIEWIIGLCGFGGFVGISAALDKVGVSTWVAVSLGGLSMFMLVSLSSMAYDRSSGDGIPLLIAWLVLAGLGFLAAYGGSTYLEQREKEEKQAILERDRVIAELGDQVDRLTRQVESREAQAGHSTSDNDFDENSEYY